MSAEAVTAVLHHSNTKGAAKLVLWGIANHYGDGGAWPSNTTLAKYAGITERRVQQITKELEASGEIAIEEQGGFGQGQYKTNRYWILIQCPTDCDGSLNHNSGVKFSASGAKFSAIRGEISDNSGVKPASPEPIFNKPNVKPNKETEEALKQFKAVWPKSCEDALTKKAFAKAIAISTIDEIVTGVKNYKLEVEAQRKTGFNRSWKSPAAWLNQELWKNYQTVVEPTTQKNKSSYLSGNQGGY